MKRTYPADLLPAIANESQADYAYRLLELRIVALDLKPGQAVTEAGLCAEMGLGRTPVREALQRLAREWLIIVLPRRGMLVSDIDAHSQMRMIEARRSIERDVVKLATRRARPQQQAAFLQLARDFEALVASRDLQALSHTDGAFNRLTMDTAGNVFLSSALERMHALSRRFWYVQSRNADIFVPTVQLHAALARAIAGGDADHATRALEALLDFSEQTTRASIG